jgi:hypothetical protein
MRIVSFGCSYTYGHGLEDCLDNDKITQGPNPSKLAYPATLAKHLNCDYINLGKSGNSNKEIWHDILNFNFQQDDIVVITWTYFSRFCIIKPNSIKRINPWLEDSKSYYMNYSNRHDMIIDFYSRLNHVSFYLDTLNIKNYNFVIEDPDKETPVWSRTNVLGLFEMLDKADDNCHPGKLSHDKFAEKIYNEVMKSLPDKHLK